MSKAWGSAVKFQKMTDAEYIERIRSQCKAMPSGCFEWQGYLHPEGYGTTSYRGRAWRVHRLIYTLVKGLVPDHLMVCHTCDNRKCCNIDHLWLGTRGDNLRDMAAKGRHQEQVKTHCPRGHAYDAINTYFTPHGSRNCKTCMRARGRIKAGWPEHLAYELPSQPLGYTINPNHPRNSFLNGESR